jgi:large subunit ribosomal protein L24
MVRGLESCSIDGIQVCFGARAHRPVRGLAATGFGDGVQTTLLGLAIAIILALVAALVGPHFVDWGQYRAEFESRASRLIGLTVHVAGPIEARLLPTPMLFLSRIEVVRPGDKGASRAKSLSIEFALSSLMRGELRAAELRVDGAEFAVGLDGQGRVDWPAASLGFDPDAISIQRLDIVDSRAILADAASGASLVLDKLEFRGELRSLAGPVKGEGSFVVGGQHYPYRLGASRVGDDGGVRVRLNVDPIDRPLIAEADAVVYVERGVPRFEGTLQLARPVGRAPDGIIEPWRVTSRIKGDATGATLEQVEFQYGPDERAIKLRGNANLTFGQDPQLAVGLSSTQVDLDRMLALPEATRRRPLVAVKAFADYFGGTQRLPIPLKLVVSAENVMLAGATLQRVSGEVRADRDAFNVDVLDFRAPGGTQVGLSGRLNLTAKSIGFAGRAKVEARDPRALLAWLSDRNDVQAISAGALRAVGDVTIGSEMIAIDGLKADLDRMALEGRLSYSWASGERPPRIEAVLSAPELDLDRAYGLAQGVFAGTAFEWPREGALAVKVDRASIAGVEARRADVSLQFDRRGLEIERFAIGDFGGAALAAKGRIDTRTASPRGAITLDLDARSLDGVATLLEKFAPQAVPEFRRRATRFIPAKLTASLTVNGDAARPAGAPASTQFIIGGSAGAFRVNLQGDADGAGDVFTAERLSQLGAAKVKLAGRIEAGDGRTLVELLGLDQIVAVDQRAGRLNLTASGSLDGDAAVDGQLVAGGLDLAAKGTVRLTGSQGPTASLALKVGSANLRTQRPVAAGRPAETLATALTANLALAEGTVSLNDLLGKIAGTEIGGRLKLGLAQPMSVDGDIELGEINLPSAIAAAIGAPAQAGRATAMWPSEPFEPGLLGGFSGQIAMRSAHVSVTPRLAAKNVRGILQFGPSELAFEDIDGTLAGGRVAGDMMFQRGADGVTAHTRLRFASADLAELIRGGPPPLSGRLTIDVDLEGNGRSPIALIGSLKGSGTFTVQDGRILRLDPAAFDAVIRSVDQGLPIDVNRIRERMEQALGNGALSIPLAEGEIVVAAGQARLGNTVVRAHGADLALGGSVDLAHDVLDARLTFSGAARSDAPAGTRPEIGIALKGPVDAPTRTLEVVALSSWLALRAVENQTKRIDALESGREQPVNPSAPAAPAVTPPASSPPASATPPRAARSVPETQVVRPRPPAPTTGQAPALPPPLDLRPPTSGGPRQVQPPPSFLPPASRGSTLWENATRP